MLLPVIDEEVAETVTSFLPWEVQNNCGQSGTSSDSYSR